MITHGTTIFPPRATLPSIVRQLLFILWLDADDVVERSKRRIYMALKTRLTRQCGCGDDEISYGDRAGRTADADL